MLEYNANILLFWVYNRSTEEYMMISAWHCLCEKDKIKFTLHSLTFHSLCPHLLYGTFVPHKNTLKANDH